MNMGNLIQVLLDNTQYYPKKNPHSKITVLLLYIHTQIYIYLKLK